VYAPLAALLFVDFFFIRKQKLSLRSAFALPGFSAYKYSKGFNFVGFCCMALGVAISLVIYNPITSEVRIRMLFYFTPTGFSFLGTGVLYFVIAKIPPIRKYILRDRNELTV
jgi:NCS1 family nucleobase:cation symporter-1